MNLYIHEHSCIHLYAHRYVYNNDYKYKPLFSLSDMTDKHLSRLVSSAVAGTPLLWSRWFLSRELTHPPGMRGQETELESLGVKG
jgi:hypothetical protein